MIAAWAEIESALDGILTRRWYTNHGPLARRLEAECADAAGQRFAIAVTNPTIGLIMLADALALSGEVLLSPLSPPRAAHSLQWAGLQPRFCDIDPTTLGMDPFAASGSITRQATALLATAGSDALALAAVAAEHGLRFYRDTVAGDAGPQLIDLPAWGDDAGAACILTDDEHLAARLRNIRSSYGAGGPVPVVRTANGRLSEAQAAMALLVPPNQRLRRADPIAPPQAKTLAYGKQLLLVAEDVAAFTDLTARLSASSVRYVPLQLDHRAGHCTEAVRTAERTVIVDAPGFGDPVWN